MEYQLYSGLFRYFNGAVIFSACLYLEQKFSFMDGHYVEIITKSFYKNIRFDEFNFL
jgi:hypothetical protein